MKHIQISGNARVTGKKADVKSVRKEEKVPCVFYGQGIENISFSVDAKALALITDTPYSYIVDLDIDGKKYMAKLQEVQYHPVNDNAIHADFLAVAEDKPVTIDVPIKVVGNSEGVKQGGKLAVQVRKLKVCGLPANVPDELPVDITTLQIGKRITAGNLNYDNIQIVSPKATIVCSVKSTRAAVEATEAAAE